MERRIRASVPEHYDGTILRDFIKLHLGLSSRQLSAAKFRPDGITVNGDQVTVRRVLQAGDLVTVLLEEEETGSDHLLPAWEEISVCYEDEDLLVVEKPAGVVVHPSHGHYADSLANRITGYYARRELHVVVRPIGRLDKDTSGLICFAKNGAAASCLERERRDGTLHRFYLALCDGHFEQSEGVVEAPIGDDPDSLMKRRIDEAGEYAKTAYRVIGEQNGISLIALMLYTGRTHQIRVHMAHLGHPLIGDPLYHPAFSGGCCARAMLHASCLTGPMPFTGEPFLFTCPPPDDFTSLFPADYSKILTDLPESFGKE